MSPDQIKGNLQAVVDGLTPLAQKMEVPVSQLYQAAIRHSYAMAATDLVEAIAAGIAFFFVVRFLVWANQPDTENDPSYSRMEIRDLDVPVMLIGAVGVVAAFIFLYALEDGINRLIAPNWYAFSDIVSLIKDN